MQKAAAPASHVNALHPCKEDERLTHEPVGWLRTRGVSFSGETTLRTEAAKPAKLGVIAGTAAIAQGPQAIIGYGT